jgi:anti-sigma factor RsiW
LAIAELTTYGLVRALDAATAALIDAAIARDPDLAARVERQRKLAQAVHAAYEPILQEPMPKRLRVRSPWPGRW